MLKGTITTSVAEAAALDSAHIFPHKSNTCETGHKGKDRKRVGAVQRNHNVFCLSVAECKGM